MAEAELYSKKLLAEGNYLLLTAQAKGITEQVNALGGDPNKFISYSLVEKGEYGNIARELSNGLKGTNPIIFAKGGTGSENSISDTIVDLTASSMVLAEKYKQMTGIDIAGKLFNSKSDDTRSSQINNHKRYSKNI